MGDHDDERRDDVAAGREGARKPEGARDEKPKGPDAAHAWAARAAKPDADARSAANSEFIRAENEDDDGYDPYSDRRPEREPLFERDPWD